MAKKPEKQFWKIEGYDSTAPIYEQVIALGQFNERRMTAVLQRLASRHLEPEEIVTGSLRRNAKDYAPHFEPLREGPKGKRFSIMVGTNPYYIASVWRESEL